MLCDLRGAGDSLHRIISTDWNDQEWCIGVGKQTDSYFPAENNALCVCQAPAAHFKVKLKELD